MSDLFELRFQGIEVRFDADWLLMAYAPHGAFLSYKPVGLSIHIRAWLRHGDAAWLRGELLSQNYWKRPPTDIDARSRDDHNIIGGTFRYVEPGNHVREWFVSNGRRTANASLLFPDDTPRTSLEPYERLIDSVVFLSP